MERTRVLLAEDHSVVRRGLRKILESDTDLEIVGEEGDGCGAVVAAKRLRPAVVVIDIDGPGRSGIEATSEIIKGVAGTSVLVLSMRSDDVSVRQALKAGAKGYLLKDSKDLELVKAVQSLARGGSYFSPAVSKVLLAGYANEPNVSAGEGALSRLTSREREVLQLISEGKTNKEIARILALSINTVETHRKHVMGKLDLHNTAEIVRFAVRNGM